MADHEDESNESAEAKNPAEVPGTLFSPAHGKPWHEGTYQVLGILYDGAHIVHWVWLQAQDLVNPLVQPWS
ncbi:putative protein OS=Streptomyces griseomycini OX=66895 GN=FHS37_007641 PE=4 SV=1 [Streptomyces griseomycini]